MEWDAVSTAKIWFSKTSQTIFVIGNLHTAYHWWFPVLLISKSQKAMYIEWCIYFLLPDSIISYTFWKRRLILAYVFILLSYVQLYISSKSQKDIIDLRKYKALNSGPYHAKIYLHLWELELMCHNGASRSCKFHVKFYGIQTYRCVAPNVIVMLWIEKITKTTNNAVQYLCFIIYSFVAWSCISISVVVCYFLNFYNDC